MQISVPTLIAWRNLTHDRARFAVTVAGIAFSVVLMGMQIGLLLNFISTTSMMATHLQADIFITAPGVKSVDISTPQNERRRFQALSVPGVLNAEAITLDFSQWKRPDGVAEIITLVGVSPSATMGIPWNVSGTDSPAQLLALPEGVLVDQIYREKLGVGDVGQLVEINGVRARVAGTTNGIRTFTQSPFVFTSLSNARRMIGRGDSHASYILVKVAAGFDVAEVRDRLQARLTDARVILAQDFASSSSNYWLFTTGAGVSLIMSAVLGLLIGGVIVAQTLYASTMDRLQEYAMLRAIGGSARYLYRVVLTQATLAGVIGCLIGIAITLPIVWLGRNASAAPELPGWLAAVITLSTLVNCWFASTVSLRAINRIDPVSVFK